MATLRLNNGEMLMKKRDGGNEVKFTKNEMKIGWWCGGNMTFIIWNLILQMMKWNGDAKQRNLSQLRGQLGTSSSDWVQRWPQCKEFMKIWNLAS